MSFVALRRFWFPPVCPGCDAPGDDDLLCGGCSRRVVGAEGLPPLIVPGCDAVLAPCVYSGLVRTLLTRLKYAGDRHAAAALGALLAPAAVALAARARPDCVVPAPTSASRRRRRGFDQAELLAKSAAKVLGAPCLAGVLRRVARRPPQAGLDRSERLANLDGAFASEGAFGRSVLLVDDVVTTGATLGAAAAALRAGGARRVVAAAVARTIAPHEASEAAGGDYTAPAVQDGGRCEP
ncbi:MAG TPA: phosphoribosyltransferase family protein [Planctomycetota bacterium]|nr:phosphoribosyltransferase family protein [Planctomycetota bacterium]